MRRRRQPASEDSGSSSEEDEEPAFAVHDVEPDSGTRYAGYIIILKKGDDILAEAATTGMKKRVAPLLSKEKKK